MEWKSDNILVKNKDSVQKRFAQFQKLKNSNALFLISFGISPSFSNSLGVSRRTGTGPPWTKRCT